MEGKLCLANLIAFYDEVAWLMRGEESMQFILALLRLLMLSP